VWDKREALLVGYSFGADVLPFIVDRLPPDLRSRITGMVLVGLSPQANWELKLRSWLPGAGQTGMPVAPEIARQSRMPILYLHGARDASQCPDVPNANVTDVVIGKTHHLDGNYPALADRILAFGRASGSGSSVRPCDALWRCGIPKAGCSSRHAGSGGLTIRLLKGNLVCDRIWKP
jgi:type IV secretory pathway VirJ component